MAFQRAAELAEGRQLLFGKIAGLSQHRIKQGRGVAFAQNETIALGPMRIFRVIAKNAAEKESHRNLHPGQGTGRMPRTGGGSAGDDSFADRLGVSFQFR